MTDRVYRWEIPIDDLDHERDAAGPVVHVAEHRHDRARVEFWTVDPSDEEFWAAPIGTREHARPPGPPRAFRVFGTGHPIPPGYVHRATAARTADGLVWHLFERAEPDPVQIHLDAAACEDLAARVVHALRRREQGDEDAP